MTPSSHFTKDPSQTDHVTTSFVGNIGERRYSNGGERRATKEASNATQVPSGKMSRDRDSRADNYFRILPTPKDALFVLFKL